MDINDLLQFFQSAYTELHNTETDILRAIDNKEAVFLVLLDLSATFDSLDHQHLLTLLKDQIGIAGVALKWFTY